MSGAGTKPSHAEWVEAGAKAALTEYNVGLLAHEAEEIGKKVAAFETAAGGDKAKAHLDNLTQAVGSLDTALNIIGCAEKNLGVAS
jgi:hypothetical protein